MKLRKTMGGLLLSAFLFTAIGAADKANFNGQWVMDKTKSTGLPPEMEQRMKVEQDGDKISIETSVFQGDDVNTVPDSYTLDGKEVEIPARLQSGEQTKAKRTAKWNDAGNGFEVRDVAVFDTVDGKVTITTVRKWALGADGKSLVIEMSRTTPDGDAASRRLFNRK